MEKTVLEPSDITLTLLESIGIKPEHVEEFAKSLVPPKASSAANTTSSKQEHPNSFAIFRETASIDHLLSRPEKNIVFLISVDAYYYEKDYLEPHINIFRNLIEDELILGAKTCWNFTVLITDTLQTSNILKSLCIDKQSMKNPLPISSTYDDIVIETESALNVQAYETAKSTWHSWGENKQGNQRKQFGQLEQYDNVRLKYQHWSGDKIAPLISSELYKELLMFLKLCFIRGYKNLKQPDYPLSKFDINYMCEEIVIFFLYVFRGYSFSDHFEEPLPVLHAYPGRLKKMCEQGLDLLEKYIRSDLGQKLLQRCIKDENIRKVYSMPLRSQAVHIKHIDSEYLEKERMGLRKNNDPLKYVFTGTTNSLRQDSGFRINARRRYIEITYRYHGILCSHDISAEASIFFKAYLRNEKQWFRQKTAFEYQENIDLQGTYADKNDQHQLYTGIIKPFMENMDYPSGTCLLLLGESGSGKSSFTQQLGRKIWAQLNDNLQSTWYPLVIDLKSININKSYDIIFSEIFEKNSHFISRETFHTTPILLILDGFDEVRKLEPRFFTRYQLDHYKNLRIIATCALSYYNQGLKSNPRRENFGGFPTLKQVIINPIDTEKELSCYIEGLINFNKELKDLGITLDNDINLERYLELIEDNSSIRQIIINPFLLSLTLQVLPQIIKKYGNDVISAYKIILMIIEKNKKRSFQGQGKKEYPLINLDYFLQAVALRMVASYNPFYLDGQAITHFTDDLKKIKNVDDYLTKNPLVKYSTHTKSKRLEFTHSMVRDVVLAALIRDEIHKCKLSPVNKGLPFSNAVIAKLKIQEFLELLNLLSNELTDENKKRLLEIINHVRSLPYPRPEHWQRVSSNALSTLAQSRFSFKGMNLSNIEAKESVLAGIKANHCNFTKGNFQGANLIGAFCDSTNFTQADLTNANLSRAWIRAAELTEANLSGINLGQFPYLYHGDFLETIDDKENQSKPIIKDFVIDYEGNKLFSISENTIIIWDLSKSSCQTILTSNLTFTCLSYSQSTKTLLLGTTTKGFALLNCDEKTLYFPESLYGHAIDVNISDNGLHIAAAFTNGALYYYDRQQNKLSLLHAFAPGSIKKIAMSKADTTILACDDQVLWSFKLREEKARRYNIIFESKILDFCCDGKDETVVVSTPTKSYYIDRIKGIAKGSDMIADQLVLSPNGKILTHKLNNTLIVINPITDEIITTIAIPIMIKKISINHDASVLVATTTELGDPIQLWSLNKHELQFTRKYHDKIIASSILPDQSGIVTVYSDSTIWTEYFDSEAKYRPALPNTEVTSVKFYNSAGNLLIITAEICDHEGHIVRVANTLIGETWNLQVFTNKIACIDFDDPYLAVSCINQMMYIFEITKDNKTELIHTIEGVNEFTSVGIKISSNLQNVAYVKAYSSDDGDFEHVHVTYFKKQKTYLVSKLQKFISEVKMSKDGFVVASSNWQGETYASIYDGNMHDSKLVGGVGGVSTCWMDLSSNGRVTLVYRPDFRRINIFTIPKYDRVGELLYSIHLKDRPSEIKFVDDSYDIFVRYRNEYSHIWKRHNSSWVWCPESTSSKVNNIFNCEQTNFNRSTGCSDNNIHLLLQNGALFGGDQQQQLPLFRDVDRGEGDLSHIMRKIKSARHRPNHLSARSGKNRLKTDYQNQITVSELQKHLFHPGAVSQFPFSKTITTILLLNTNSQSTEEEIKQQVEHIEPKSRMIKLLAATRGGIELNRLSQFSVLRPAPTVDQDHESEQESSSDTTEPNSLGYNPLMK